MKSKLIQGHNEPRRELYNSRLGIIFNGDYNDNPTIVGNLIERSPTAKQVVGLYSSFLSGSGFNIDLDHLDLDGRGMYAYTPNDLLIDVAQDWSAYAGSFVHVKYNGAGEKVAFKVVPYELCRLGKQDDEQFSGKVVVSKIGWGRYNAPEDREVFHAYNPNKEIILEQIAKAEGIKKYKGQIAFLRLNTKYAYPIPLIESAYLYADTEYHLSLFYNSTVKRGFKDVAMLRHKAFKSEDEKDDFFANLKAVTGVQNSGSILAYEDDLSDPNDSFIKIDTLKSDEKPDRYAHFEQSAANQIRKAFRNPPPNLLDAIEGKLGNTSADAIKLSVSLYNSFTAQDRSTLLRNMKELLDNYKEPIDVESLEIEQYSLLNDGRVE